MSDGRLKTEIPLGGLLALVPLMPIYVIAQVDQILSKHRRIWIAVGVFLAQIYADKERQDKIIARSPLD